MTPACPHCGKTVNIINQPHEHWEPGPGDHTVCFFCTGVGVYENATYIRVPTAAEQAYLDDSPELAAIRKRILHMTGRGL